MVICSRFFTTRAYSQLISQSIVSTHIALSDRSEWNSSYKLGSLRESAFAASKMAGPPNLYLSLTPMGSYPKRYVCLWSTKFGKGSGISNFVLCTSERFTYPMYSLKSFGLSQFGVRIQQSNGLHFIFVMSCNFIRVSSLPPFRSNNFWLRLRLHRVDKLNLFWGFKHQIFRSPRGKFILSLTKRTRRIVLRARCISFLTYILS